MKDIDNANVILGTKLIRNNNKIVLTQFHFKSILRKFERFDYKLFFWINDYKLLFTSFDHNIMLLKNDDRCINQLKYVNIIDSFKYVMHCTRPYMAYVVSVLTRFIHNPRY